MLVNELAYCLSLLLLLKLGIDFIDEIDPLRPELPEFPTTTAPIAAPIVPLFDNFGLTISSISSSDSKSLLLYSIEFLIDFI